MLTLVKWEWFRQSRVPRIWVVGMSGPVVGILVAYLYGRLGSQAASYLSLVSHVRNGLYVPVMAVTIALPFLLPVLVSVVGGDLVAGERQLGTWNTLLMTGVDPAVIFLAKWVIGMGYCILVGAGMVGSSLVAGAVLYGVHRVLLPSGDLISATDMLRLILIMTGYTCVGLTVVMTLALVVSALVNSAVSAVLATLIVISVMTIINAIPAFGNVTPYLFVTYFNYVGGLWQRPANWSSLNQGLVVYGAYVAFLLSVGFWASARRE